MRVKVAQNVLEGLGLSEPEKKELARLLSDKPKKRKDPFMLWAKNDFKLILERCAEKESV